MTPYIFDNHALSGGKTGNILRAYAVSRTLKTNGPQTHLPRLKNQTKMNLLQSFNSPSFSLVNK